MFFAFALIIVLLSSLVLIILYRVKCVRDLFASRFGIGVRDFEKCVRWPVLLVTAHPDDEVMFFGPCINNLLKSNKTKTFLMCITNGNGDNGKDGRRVSELMKATSSLGFQEENVTVYDKLGSCFIDSLSADWNLEELNTVIQTTIKEHDIKTVITFDHYGVSGHRNHYSIYNALEVDFIASNKDEPCVVVLTLESVGLIRKYSSFLDVWLTLIYALTNRKMTFFANLNGIYKTWAAMKLHVSQFIWFRKLYIIFSRYIWMNSFNINYLKLK